MKRPRPTENNGIASEILRLRSAHDHLLDAAVAASDQVAVAEEKAARAERGHDLHVGSSLSDEVRVIVLKILAGTDAGWPARWVRTRREIAI